MIITSSGSYLIKEGVPATTGYTTASHTSAQVWFASLVHSGRKDPNLCITDTRYGYSDTAIREFKKRHSGSIERVSEYRNIEVSDTQVSDTGTAGLVKQHGTATCMIDRADDDDVESNWEFVQWGDNGEAAGHRPLTATVSCRVRFRTTTTTTRLSKSCWA